MNVKIIAGMAFVGDKYLLCIGTEEEVVNSTPEQLSAMVMEATARARFNSIECSKGQKIH